MLKLCFFLIGFVLCRVGAARISAPDEDELLSVVVIFRHGERTTIDVYPNDPYKDISYWPDGFGQLTNEGRQQHYALGKWLRNRYNSFLPEKYSHNDFLIKSSDVIRTLMSAQCNLAGLYPPKGDQIWEKTLNWQPIPVHTKPKPEDAVVAQAKSCPKYDKLLEELMETDYFRAIDEENKQMYAELTELTGQPVESIEDIRTLYYTLYTEEHFNYTLPEWTSKYYPDKLRWLAGVAFGSRAYTPELARLITGPLLDEIVKHFVNITENVGNPYQKFKVYSAHDTTLSNALSALGAFEPHWPKTAASLMFELKRREDGFYMDVFYKQGDDLVQVKLKDCDRIDCPFTKFVDVLKPVTVDLDTWEKECRDVE